MENKFYKIFFSGYLIIILFLYGCSKIHTDNKKSIFSSRLELEKNKKNQLTKDKQKLIEYFFNKQYTELESKINELSQNNENAGFIDSIYSSIISGNNVLQNLNEWCAVMPNSYIVYTARGCFYINYAWEIVDRDYGQNNPEDAILIFNERLNLAKADLEKAYELNPNISHAAAYLITVARGLNLDENYMEMQFQRAVKADTYNNAAHINKLNYYARKWYGSHEAMIKFTIETLDRLPDDNDLGLNILTIAQGELVESMDLKNKYLQKAGVFIKIDNKYKAYIKINPEKPEILFLYAEFAMLSQKYDIALKEFEQARNKLYSSLDDDLLVSANYRAYKIYAYSLFGMEKYKEAIEPLKKLLKIAKKDPNIFKLIAHSYNKLNDEQNSIKYAKELLNIGDAGIKRYRDYGYLLYELKKYKEAVDVFLEAIKYYGDDAYSYQYLAFCYSELKMYNECIEYAKKYLEINPDSSFFKKWIRGKQLYYLYSSKKYADATALANEMIKDRENVDYAYRIIAYCYDNQENYKKAADYAEKALEINPDYKILKKWIRKRRIYYLYENSYCKEAMTQCLSALEEFGDDSDFYRILSHSANCLKDYNKCIEYGKKSLVLDPKQKVFENWLNGRIKELTGE